MTKHVLSVGQCSADDARLARMLAIEADAHLDRAHSAADAEARLAATAYDLVLVNRIIDGDGSEGVDFIARSKDTTPVPFMLVSDYADAQEAAQAAGALPGFGKGALHTPEVGQLLRQALNSATRAGAR
jgi:CheY-like chemotaxis protein